MPEQPEEPLTSLAAEAVMHHEIYDSYVRAGFSEPQALELLKTIIVTIIGKTA
ncbi:hypothetical protein [Actinacidiphila acididurans]|uniref:TetR family transcriptional regulator n=1 Tax=Actinacidiphila acididurans TaxID=2784346 RepID=A0ABS2U5H2_9ACTN|nr:hypothetical protein [Actinacidiphila acididurans]MBM9509966.1 hypothetical protein [Actinacidiphila acididurans]